MTYQLTGPLLTEYTKLTGNTATVVFTANHGNTHIATIIATENNGGTPTLTIEVNDGTNSYYLRKAVAMTAGTAFAFANEILLPHDWTIKVTSSDASGHVDVVVNYVDPVADAAKA